MMKCRESIIIRAQKDFNPNIVSLNTDAIATLTLPDLSHGFDDFSYIAPDWSVEELATLWLVFSAQAFQFKHKEKHGGLSKIHYLDSTGSNAVLKMIRDSHAEGGFQQMRALFRTLPLHKERESILNEMYSDESRIQLASQGIISSARKGWVSCDHAKQLADMFPKSFSDPYLKKAQLAVSAIAGCVQHREGVIVKDNLTAFADYEVPRILRHFGILTYSPALLAKIESGVQIEKGSVEERALRGATILAIEMIAAQFGYSASALDNYFWGAQKEIGETPVHFTDTTCY